MSDNESLERHDPLAWLAGEPETAGPESATPEPPAESPVPVADREPGGPELSGNADGVLALQPELTVQHAAQLHPLLVERLAAGGEVVLDGSAVERADGAGLQLLLAFFESAREQGATVSWQSASDPLRENARLLGMSGLLQLGDDAG